MRKFEIGENAWVFEWGRALQAKITDVSESTCVKLDRSIEYGYDYRVLIKGKYRLCESEITVFASKIEAENYGHEQYKNEEKMYRVRP
jgi:hypothetical protein